MKEWFVKLLLAALEDERVRDAVMKIIRQSQPAPKHRPISKNTAPGAI